MTNNIREKFFIALKFHEKGDFKKAELLYNNILHKNPNEVNSLHHLAILAIQNQKSLIAIKLLNKVINLEPKMYLAYNNRGIAFRNINNNYSAVKDFEKVISINPNYTEAFFNLAIAYTSLEKIEKALFYCNKAIQLNPSYAEAYNIQGIIHAKKSRFEKSINSFDNAIKYKQNYFEAYNNKGNSLFNINNLKLALEHYNKAIEINPKYMEAYISLSNLFLYKSEYELALKKCQIAININDKFEDAYVLKGIILLKMNEPHSAITNYNKCLSINSQNSLCLNGKGNAYLSLKETEKAISFYKDAISINTKFSDAHASLGLAYYNLRMGQKALEHLKTSLSINPTSTEALLNLGNTYLQIGKRKEALDNYNKAIEINQSYTKAYSNKGDVLSSYKKYDEAIVAYNTALNLEPNFELLFGTLIYTKLTICDWKNYTEDCKKYKSYLINKSNTHFPFTSLNILTDPAEQKLISERFVNKYYPEQIVTNKIKTKPKTNKIVLGYFSYDFGEHPVSYLIAELIEKHNRDEFEIIGVYYGPNRYGNIYDRVSKSFDSFINVKNKTDKEVATLCRKLKIDIAIDLTGHTKGGRIGIFSHRVANIQMSYIGYLGTIGANYYDYILADKTIIPKDLKPFYSEKILYLNHYQVNDTQKQISNIKVSREKYNIPKKSFVYCSFNNNYKISPKIFHSWMRILKAVNSSVLLIYVENIWAKENLKKEAQNLNVDVNRLFFLEKVERSEYLARLRLADLFLDTTPYNAGTTASDALWSGLPLLTCMGKTFSSRMAASILNAAELNEMITSSQSQYEKMAIKLGKNTDFYLKIKNKLNKNLKLKPLFNIDLFRKDFERVLKSVNKNYH